MKYICERKEENKERDERDKKEKLEASLREDEEYREKIRKALKIKPLDKGLKKSFDNA